MSYPQGLDTFPTLNDGEPAFAAYFNNIHTAVIAIEEALGLDPAGTHDTVAAALNALGETRPITAFLLMGA